MGVCGGLVSFNAPLLRLLASDASSLALSAVSSVERRWRLIVGLSPDKGLPIARAALQQCCGGKYAPLRAKSIKEGVEETNHFQMWRKGDGATAWFMNKNVETRGFAPHFQHKYAAKGLRPWKIREK